MSQEIIATKLIIERCLGNLSHIHALLYFAGSAALTANCPTFKSLQTLTDVMTQELRHADEILSPVSVPYRQDGKNLTNTIIE